MNPRPFSLLISLVSTSFVASTASAAVPPHDAVVQFGKKVEATINQKDSAVLNAALDMNAILDRSFEGIDVNPTLRKQIQAEMSKPAKLLGTQIAQELAKTEAGKYKFLRVRTKTPQQKTALFRIVSEAGVNYHDMDVQMQGGQLRVVDVYVLLTGEWLSKSLRRAFLPVIAHNNRGILDKLTGQTSAYMDNIDTILKITRLKKSGDAAGAMAAYQALPKSLKNDRNFLIMRLQIANQLNDQQYQEAMTAIETVFPHDPSLGLAVFDNYFLKKEFDKALAVLDRVSRSLGGDMYLEFLRGNVMFEQGDMAGAKAAFRTAIKNEPTLADPYWSMVSISLQEKRYKQTVKWLNAVEANLDLVIGDLTTIDEYAGFVKSRAYRRWLRKRKR